MDKIEQIEKINDIEDLGRIVIGILTNLQFIDIRFERSFVACKYDHPLGQQRMLFYLSLDYLGKGYQKFELLKKNLFQEIKRGEFTLVYVVSIKVISEGFKAKLQSEFQNFRFEFWGRDYLISKIDSEYSSYWRHTEQELLAYEKIFEDQVNDDWSIKKIKQFQKAHEKLLKIFVEPRLLHKVNDFESPKKALVRIGIE